MTYFGAGMTMNASMNSGYGSEHCSKRTKNQCKILNALMNNSAQSLTELSNRIGLAHQIIQRELAGLISCQIVLKDGHKLYSLNPAYGKFLIDEGLAVLGYNKPPDEVRFVSLIYKLRLTVKEILVCAKRVYIFLIGSCGWLLMQFCSYLALFFFMLFMTLN